MGNRCGQAALVLISFISRCHVSTLPTVFALENYFPSLESVANEDFGEQTTKLFNERLQAWKHAVGYLEEYIKATEKLHHSQSKDYEKVLKSVSTPLKEGHHFDQQLGGVAGIFDNLRSNTQGIANSHTETEKALKGSVLPVFERLHAEIKNKQKELLKGAGKGSKVVDKARNATQKQIEFLGQHTASFDSAGGRISANEDPFIIQRQVRHHLHKQVMEENSNRQDLLSVQNSFSQFEAHVVKTIQTGMGDFNQVVNTQLEQSRNMYGNITMTAQKVGPDFEWKGFVSRNSELLIDPGAPNRSVKDISFPNENHRATQPLIAGSLQRRTKVLRKFDTGYYVVTPAKYLHEFASDDDFSKDPSPELSLYLPDCSVGAIDGAKFNVKGKNVGKGSVVNKMSMSHDLAFQAHTPADASKWWDIIRSAAGQVTTDVPETPVDTTRSPTLPGGSNTTATPTSATSTTATPISATATSATESPNAYSGTTAVPPQTSATTAETDATGTTASPYIDPPSKSVTQ